MSLHNSDIEWTDGTWNFLRGCTKISPGCKHCYAETFAERWRGIAGHPYEHGFDLRFVPSKLHGPVHLLKSKRIFVNSMSDLFHADVPDKLIHGAFEVMMYADWNIYQILTKRHDRIRSLCNRWDLSEDYIWIGVSVENRRNGLPRINALRNTDAAVRFLSIEPLIEDIGEIDLTGIHWVIAGAESGHQRRPAQIDWFRSIRDQCAAAGVPFFLKQAGICGDCQGTGVVTRYGIGQPCPTCHNGMMGTGMVKDVRKGCPALDGVVHNAMPAFTFRPRPIGLEYRERRDAVHAICNDLMEVKI